MPRFVAVILANILIVVLSAAVPYHCYGGEPGDRWYQVSANDDVTWLVDRQNIGSLRKGSVRLWVKMVPEVGGREAHAMKRWLNQGSVSPGSGQSFEGVFSYWGIAFRYNEGSRPQKQVRDYGYNQELWQIDCGSREITRLKLMVYTTDGDLIDSFEAQDPRPSTVVPESPAELVAGYACKVKQ